MNERFSLAGMRAPVLVGTLSLLGGLGLLGALPGCIVDVGEAPGGDLGDIVVFAEAVQPVFEARCANPSCHGRADRPLEIYASQLHRMDEAERFRNTVLDEEELRHNALRASFFVSDLEGGSSLLRKTIPLEVGGMEHGAGPQFFTTDDRGYEALARWVQSVEEERNP